jgi:hypothetical protein
VNAANTFGTDSLDPPGSFASSRPCTATSARLRAATTAVSSVAASITVAVPATVVGDYLVALVGTQDSPPPPIPTAAQTGWTQATTNTQGNERLTIFTRPTPATPPASYSFTIPTGASVVATMMSFSEITGVGASATVLNASSSTATAPSVTPATANSLLLSFFSHAETSMTTPSGMRPSSTVAGGYYNTRVRVFEQNLADTSATGARTGTLGAAKATIGASLVLRANPPGAPDPTITLSWTATPDTYATGYEISRTGGPTTTVTGRTTLAWSDTTTTAATAYTYTVAAVSGTWQSTTSTINVATC